MIRRPARWPVATSAALVATLLAVGSCGPRRAPSRPLPATAAELASLRPPPAPFRAALRGRVRGPGGKGRFGAGLGAVPPDFRIDLFHPISRTTLFSLGIVEGVLRAVWPASTECLEARATSRLMDDLLGLELDPEDLLPLLTGHVYPDAGVEVTPRVATAGGSRVAVDAVATVGEVSWSASLAAGRGGLAVEGRRQGRDGEEIRVEYPRWVAAGAGGGAGLPRTVRLSVPSRGLQFRLEVREWAAGGPPREALLPTFPPDCVLLAEIDLGGRRAPWLLPDAPNR